MTAVLPILFAVTLFVAACLVFVVQPMIARMVLPILGGSPSVWTTCMMFFQAALLAGYAYAHLTTAWLAVRWQVVVHVLVLLTAWYFLPLRPPDITAMDGGLSTGGELTWIVLGWLARSIGWPFFAVACTAPLLQHWFAATGHRSARDPYFLYAASNAGSLLALLAYPLWIERRLRLGGQSAAWGLGFGVLTLLVALCAMAIARGPRETQSTSVRASRSEWFAWIAFALVPSSLLLGVTTYLTTDLAAIPLLWVVPLGLYLLSFIVVFGPGSEWATRISGRILPFLVMVLAPVMAVGLVQPFWIPLHLVTFFTAAVVCHGELARRRPPAERLTAFYLALAIGGALGGAFNALIAPVVFDRLAEYPLALVAACLALAFREGVSGVCGFGRRDLILPILIGLGASAFCAGVGGLAENGLGAVVVMAASGLSALVAVYHRRRPIRFALTVGALLLASSFYDAVTGRVIDRRRSFFSVLKVTEAEGGRVHRLFHGSTLHGQQGFTPERRYEPSTYFDRTGPMGQVFAVFNGRRGRETARVAVTGMGAGSLAAYAEPGQRWTFAEIDPAVVRIARDPRFFTYLSDCRAARLDVVLGDARITLGRAEDGEFDLIVLDAFSSDSIPVHLLTREALALDRRKLADGGMIAVNITNRYLDMAPVVARLARDAGLACRVRFDPVADRATGKQGSIWAVLTSNERDLGSLAKDVRWFIPQRLDGDTVWTDDFSNLLDHVRLGRRH